MPNPRALASYDCFAITAPGLEPLCAAELRALGIARAHQDSGGVAWRGSFESLVRANLWLRTASRVLVRIARFRATEFYELERQAKRIPWERFVAQRARVEFRVTCRKSKLYHSDAVAQRFAEAIARQSRAIVGPSESENAADDEELDAPDRQLFIVRFVHDVCTVSADSSGALLHFRGYRQALAKAPLRETLAAAVLLGSGWTGDAPLVDPMCGSGTIPIEAARIARHIAPGRSRTFALTNWPEADAKLTSALIDDARARELPRSPVPIAGSDRDAGAIEAARANAERAGVAEDVEFTQRTISALPPHPADGHGEGRGLVASNPPYGVRIGDRDRLRNLYAQLGNVLRRTHPGWTLALLSADRKLERVTALEFEERFRTRNGGIPVRLVVAPIDAAAELGRARGRALVR